MMACRMRNKTLLFKILVASVFLTLWMNAVVLSVAEMVPALSNTTTVNRCIETERQALLLIKQSFVDEYGQLSSWGSPQDEDCCHWTRVGCDNGHVTHLMLSDVSPDVTYSGYLGESVSNISHSLLKLKYLKYLDLSGNNFGGQPIPKFVGSLSNLVYLDLSWANFTGEIPEEIGNLSRLYHLDLSYNHGLECRNFGWLVRLSSLTHLHLSSCNMSGNLEDILNVLPEDSLEELWISENELTGSLPDITQFSSLTGLNVRFNHLRGSLPSFTGFSHLEELDLSSNNFSGTLPEFTGMQSLKRLDFQHNGFSGTLPDFTGLQSLEELYLSQNHFSGSLPDFTGCSSLLVLWLEENEITEWKTQSIGQLTNLTDLRLSNNSIHSTITESHLSNLSSLQYLDTSSNSLTINFSPGWLPPFQLSVLNLGSSKLGPKFPNWIRNQTHIDYLNFSNCQISDTIPMWFWNISSTMNRLDLSSNKIRGHFLSKLFDGEVIDLSYNHLEGPIPLISSYTWKINLSNNKFVGELFSLSAVENMSLISLDCSNNLMFGVLPTTWVYFPSLIYLNVGHNNFSGIIPLSIGYLTSLQTLILRNNTFSGGLPDSLKNCSNLGFADFGLNNLSGEIPAWIGEDLPQLYALMLRSNKFHGSLPYHICRLSKLQFLDLSTNKISGSIPQCFGNLTGMIERGTKIAEHNYTYIIGVSMQMESYLDPALADWKGQERKYGRNFAYLKMIDLSQNELTGEIPIELTRLLDLKGLNLSWNKFNGEVPQKIGQLKMLECLDLSRNRFSGEIPQTMSGLNFLGYLDLSNNNFSGRIPSGTQLQGFNISVYEGNVGLCGPPLENICRGDEADDVQPPSDANEADEDEIEYKRWLYISATLGYGTTLWGVCGILVLNRHWRHAYFLFLNNLKDQLYVIVVLRIAKLRM